LSNAVAIRAPDRENVVEIEAVDVVKEIKAGYARMKVVSTERKLMDMDFFQGEAMIDPALSSNT
jgi:hypothetical protein